MHEASIIESAFALGFARMRQEGATRILQFQLRIGALSGVVPEALQFAFEAMKENTPASGAELVIVCVSTLLCCHDCGTEFEAENHPDLCPKCGSWQTEVCRGREMEVVSLELSCDE